MITPEPLLVLHLLVVVVAFGVALGFSLAHRFWPGAVIACGAIVAEVLIGFTGLNTFSIAVHQPLTVLFAYFIVKAGEREGAVHQAYDAEARCRHVEAAYMELEARTSGDVVT